MLMTYTRAKGQKVKSQGHAAMCVGVQVDMTAVISS